MVENKRNYNLDIIRLFALLCVISVHFFYNNGFYSEIIQGKTLFISIIIRSFFMICVPLFLILTGYLMNNKEPSKKYFFGIKKILIEYVICSFICYFFFSVFNKTNINLYDMFFGILSFKNARYSWYVEMYIGLYFLIPYLNIIYKELNEQKKKKTLIIVLFIISILPTFTNTFNFKRVNIINDIGTHQQILPAYWYSIYPLFYYFVGCYINEYKPNIGKIKNILLIFISTLLFGTLCFIQSYNHMFSWNYFQSYNSVFVSLNAILIFIYLLNIKLNFNHLTGKILKSLSNSVFCGYLLSSIFDTIYYKIFLEKADNWIDKLINFPLLVVLIFISTIISALILTKIVSFIKNSFKNRGDKSAKV